MKINRRRVIIAGLAAGGFAGCARKDADGLAYLGIGALSKSFRSGAVAPLDALRACLSRIERFDEAINSFCYLAKEEALEAAGRAGAEIRGGRWRGPLHGVPIAIKDNIDVRECRRAPQAAR